MPPRRGLVAVDAASIAKGGRARAHPDALLLHLEVRLLLLGELAREQPLLLVLLVELDLLAPQLRLLLLRVGEDLAALQHLLLH